MSSYDEFGRGTGRGGGGGVGGRNFGGGGRHQNVPYRSNDGSGSGISNGRCNNNNNNNSNYNNNRNQQRGRLGGRFENNNNNNHNNYNQQQQQPSFGGGRFNNRQNNNNNNNNNNGRGRGRNNNNYYNNRNNNNNNRRNFHSRKDYNNDDIDIIEQIGCIPNADNNTNNNNIISIAIEGCCHGELDRIYDRIAKHEQETNQSIDLLVCCGDFQSIRCIEDFHTIAIPSKYRTIGTFYQYYNIQKVVPILTIFIGGNHEVSQSLSELYYGGWVAPNIYYLGHSGVITYRGIRISGISGIYKSNDYTRIRTEIPPYNPSTIRSIYHVRNIDVYRLKCLQHNNNKNNNNSKTKVTTTNNSSNDVTDENQQQLTTGKKITIMLSHDWPLGIDQYGNTEELIRKKPFFQQEIYNNTLGSIPNRELLNILQPSYWFAGHLHVKFHATIIHNNNTNSNTKTTNNSMDQSSPIMNKKDVSFLVPSQVVASTSSTKLKNTSDDKSTTTVLTHTKDENDDKGNYTPTKMEPTSITDLVPVQSDVDEPILSNDQQENTVVANNAAAALSPPTSKTTTTATTQFIAVETATPQTCMDNNDVDDLTSQMTKFLSLDKCLPRRQYLSIVHIPCPQPTATTTATATKDSCSCSSTNDTSTSTIDVDSSAKKATQHKLQYDPEWLAIIRKTHTMQPRPTNSYNNHNQRIDLTNVPLVSVNDDDIQDIINRFNGNLEIPENFQQTVPGYKSNSSGSSTEAGVAASSISATATFAPNQQLPPPLPQMGNPQTDELLQKLQLDHILTIPWNINQLPNYYKNRNNNTSFGENLSNADNDDNVNVPVVVDDNEIDLDNIDDDVDETENNIVIDKNVVQSVNTINNNDENEIDIDNIVEEQHDENEIDINSVQIDEINTDDQHHHDLCIETNKKPRLNT